MASSLAAHFQNNSLEVIHHNTTTRSSFHETLRTVRSLAFACSADFHLLCPSTKFHNKCWRDLFILGDKFSRKYLLYREMFIFRNRIQLLLQWRNKQLLLLTRKVGELMDRVLFHVNTAEWIWMKFITLKKSQPEAENIYQFLHMVKLNSNANLATNRKRFCNSKCRFSLCMR